MILSVKSIHISKEVIQNINTSYIFHMHNEQGLCQDPEAVTMDKLRGQPSNMWAGQKSKKKMICEAKGFVFFTFIFLPAL